MDAIYYAINTRPKYLHLTRRSIEGIRRFDPDIPVYVHVFGDGEVDADFAGLDVRIVRQSSALEGSPTFLKWLPLGHPVHENRERLLFLDADTVVFSPIRGMFDRLAEHDFYARDESGAGPEPGHWARLKAELGSRDLPIAVYNSGVMLFNRGMHRKVAAVMEDMPALKRRFDENELPFPCSNPHILEEVVAALLLGRIPDATFGLIDQNASPWFLEIKDGVARHPGIVMHIWTNFYPEYLERYEGAAARDAYVQAYGP